MESRIVLVTLACLLGMAAPRAEASQDEDARALIELFADASNFAKGFGPHVLVLDGCAAEVDSGFRHFRFLLSSIDFAASVLRQDADFLVLDQDAHRQTDAWHDGRSELPRSAGGSFLEEDATDEQRREAQELLKKFNRAYYEALMRGEFGEWYRQHHNFEVAGDGRYDFEPISTVPLHRLWERGLALYAALGDYTAKYCLPAPDFSCTPFFVDAPGTVC